MIKILLGVAAAALALLLACAASQPDTFRVARSLHIADPADRIFPLLVDPKGFNRWNPYERKDPGHGRYGNASAGPGASCSWDSPKLGAGSMTIVESLAPTRLTMQLDFMKPFEVRNEAEFQLVADGDGTLVTWAMSGRSNFVSKLVQVFFNIDHMVGDDFASGLANLKALVEAR